LVRQDTSERDYESEINTLITSAIRLSKLAGDISTPAEQKQMENKKAVFVIKGLDKRYAFEITESKLVLTTDENNTTTYCYCASPQIFLDIVDKILAGDSEAFQRSLQRGDLIIKGRQSFHDQLMWKKALERIAKLRKQYSFLG